MKKLLHVLGGAFVVLVVGLGILIGYAAFNGSKLDASSKAYVDQSLPIIARAWSKEELLKRASPELTKVVNGNPEKFQQLFGKLAELGKLKRYDGSKGDSNTFVDVKHGKIVTAAYTAHATFEHGDASFSVRLVHHHGQWRYLNFNVNSPVFLK